MPDRDQILIAMAAAAAVSAVVAAGMSLAAGWPRRPLKPTLLTLGWVLGVSAGFYLGAVLLQVGPRKQLAEDRDRFLLLLIPAVIVVELITAWHRIPAWVAWVPRLIIAAVAARVLLHGSSWLPDPEDPDSTRRWTHEQTFLYLNALAADLIAVWILLSRLTRDESGLSLAPTPGRGGGYRSVLPALALTCVGTAVTVMYSGSATDGQLGLALGGALAGAAMVSLFVPAPRAVAGALGIGVVGLFGLLMSGKFFAELTWPHAAMLFGAPLLCWLPEFPFVRRLHPWLRAVLATLLVAIPVALAAMQAQKQHEEESRVPGGVEDEYEELYRSYQESTK